MSHDVATQQLRHRRESDSGNILLLALGVLVVLLGLIAVVVDLGYGYLKHVAVTSAAERIALAGASAIDALGTPTSASPGTRLQLSRRAAVAAIQTATSQESQQWAGLKVVTAKVTTQTVDLRLCGPIQFPFSWQSVAAGRGRACAQAAAATVISRSQYP